MRREIGVNRKNSAKWDTTRPKVPVRLNLLLYTLLYMNICIGSVENNGEQKFYLSRIKIQCRQQIDFTGMNISWDGVRPIIQNWIR